jgi:hypothetical protein
MLKRELKALFSIFIFVFTLLILKNYFASYYYFVSSNIELKEEKNFVFTVQFNPESNDSLENFFKNKSDYIKYKGNKHNYIIRLNKYQIYKIKKNNNKIYINFRTKTLYVDNLKLN